MSSIGALCGAPFRRFLHAEEHKEIRAQCVRTYIPKMYQENAWGLAKKVKVCPDKVHVGAAVTVKD